MPRSQGEVQLVVKDLMDRGGVGYAYRVVVQPVETAFQLTLDQPQVAIPRGGTALIPLTIARGGYNGPIRLEVRGVPAEGGVTAIPSLVPAGQTRGVVGLKAAIESTFTARDVQVVGRAEDGQTVVASQTIVFAEQTISTPGFGMAGTIPSYTRPFLSLTAAVIPPGPILLKPGPSQLVVPQGSTVELPLTVVRTTPEKKKYALAALNPPTGLSVAESGIGETGTTTMVKIAAAADAPLGALTLGLVARDPAPGGSARPRRGAAGATRGDATPTPDPPAVAAALIAVEVVRPPNQKK
jgi:hypothetical protein